MRKRCFVLISSSVIASGYVGCSSSRDDDEDDLASASQAVIETSCPAWCDPSHPEHDEKESDNEKDARWYIHDPLCADSKTGDYKKISSAAFRAAIGQEALDVLVVR